MECLEKLKIEKYKKGKEYTFNLHELVMKKSYKPQSLLEQTFTGPYRIMEIYPMGALLKCPKTGEKFSTHFKNIRKLTLSEFTTILPSHFDSDILKELFRYNSQGAPEKIKKSTSPIQDSEYTDHISDSAPDILPPNKHERRLRSGKFISLNKYSILKLNKVDSAKFHEYNSVSTIPYPDNVPILKINLNNPHDPFSSINQIWIDNCWFFKSHTLDKKIKDNMDFKRTRKKSSFTSPFAGTLKIPLPPQKNTRQVTFSSITVHFFD